MCQFRYRSVSIHAWWFLIKSFSMQLWIKHNKILLVFVHFKKTKNEFVKWEILKLMIFCQKMSINIFLLLRPCTSFVWQTLQNHFRFFTETVSSSLYFKETQNEFLKWVIRNWWFLFKTKNECVFVLDDKTRAHVKWLCKVVEGLGTL